MDANPGILYIGAIPVLLYFCIREGVSLQGTSYPAPVCELAVTMWLSSFWSHNIFIHNYYPM